MLLICCWLLLLTLSTIEVLRAHPLNIPPNNRWRCQGCQDLNVSNRIFGLIRSSIFRDHRNVYFPIETSWIDHLLLPESNVNVELLSVQNLSSVVMPAPSEPRTIFAEVFQVVFTNTLDDAAAQALLTPDAVDSFLKHNPCWLPLHGIIFKWSFLISMKDIFCLYFFVCNLWLVCSCWNLEPIIANYSHYEDDGAFVRSSSMRSSSRIPNIRSTNFAIFIRLPAFGYQATCRLFSEITRIQFPRTCNYDKDHMLVHELHNIGWSATFNALLFKLAYILRPSVYPNLMITVPQVADFRGKPRIHVEHDGSVLKDILGWYWINPSTCDSERQFYDPWACNLISITNCTERANRKSFTNPTFPERSGDYNFETPQTVRMNGFDVEDGPNSRSINALRSRFSDAPLLSEEQWVKQAKSDSRSRSNSKQQGGWQTFF